MQKMSLRVRDLLNDRSGLAAVEFAFVFPMMVVMYFGVVELSSAIAVDRKATQVARTLADLTSQMASVADADIIGQHHRHFRLCNVFVDILGGGRHGALDHGLGIGLPLPAIGDDEDLGEGEDGRHERSSALHCNVRVTAWTCLRQAQRRRFLGQDLLVAGFCGNPS